MDGELSFAQAYADHATAVFRLAFALTGSRTEAEDTTAEVFARAFASEEPIRAESVRGYLCAIARNLVASQRRRPLLEVAQPDAIDEIADPGEGPERRLELMQLAAGADAAVLALAPVDRGVLLLSALDGLSASAVGEALGLTAANVRVRLHRIRRRLSQTLLESPL
jgi:RNA polymerase sigma-70 factor (ECF subfamily)